MRETLAKLERIIDKAANDLADVAEAALMDPDVDAPLEERARLRVVIDKLRGVTSVKPVVHRCYS